MNSSILSLAKNLALWTDSVRQEPLSDWDTLPPLVKEVYIEQAHMAYKQAADDLKEKHAMHIKALIDRIEERDRANHQLIALLGSYSAKERRDKNNP